MPSRPARSSDVTLRCGGVTDLFIMGSEQYSDDEIALFDDVIIRLAAEIELSARSLLAVRLAPIPNAPPKIIRALAFDDAIEVARPVLVQSERLDDPTLVENGRRKGQEHLLAISRRRSLSEPVTDVLVERGDQRVVLSIAENRGARFSDGAFAILVRRSAGDDRLAACVGSRPEIPAHLFLDLLAKASHIVRAKLEAAHPQAKREVAASRRRGCGPHSLRSLRRIGRPRGGAKPGRNPASVGRARRRQGFERSRGMAGSTKPRPHSPSCAQYRSNSSNAR